MIIYIYIIEVKLESKRVPRSSSAVFEQHLGTEGLLQVAKARETSGRFHPFDWVRDQEAKTNSTAMSMDLKEFKDLFI